MTPKPKSFEEWWDHTGEFLAPNDTTKGRSWRAWHAALAQRDAEVCEWQEPGEGFQYHITKCRNRFVTFGDNQFKFCPFCGRKIKVVEGEGK